MSKAIYSPVQIERIAMESVHFERSESALPRAEESYNYDILLDVEVVRADPGEEGGKQSVVVTSLAVAWEEEPGPFELNVCYKAFVIHDGTVEQATFDKICRLQIPTTILGFVRPFVARLMSEAGESFRLPLIDLRNQNAPATEDET